MKPDYSKYILSFLLVILISWTSSCSGRTGERAETTRSEITSSGTAGKPSVIKIVSPEENAGFKLHDKVKVVLEPADKNNVPDSVVISFNGKAVTTLKTASWEFIISPVFTVTTGRKSLKVTAYKAGKTQNVVTRFLIVYSDIIPVRNGYNIAHSYPHDREAFTQGLVFDNGVLFEGTGQKTGSSLRETELATGKVIRQSNLDDALFGEGITLYRDRIYQVTWENKVGFVYNKPDFKVIKKIYYYTQGWGLTTIDNKIVMSDGTNVLYFYEPEMFTVESTIEVYDNEKKVDQLNELEYINGEIWANIWMTDLIARIDPVTGKVIAYIDLKGLLTESERTSDTDVLNGIAYDRVEKRIFVTGKRWPRVYEIKITE